MHCLSPAKNGYAKALKFSLFRILHILFQNFCIDNSQELSIQDKFNNSCSFLMSVLKPVWTYGIELWGCASKSNIVVIQRYQSKLLRSITMPHGMSPIKPSIPTCTSHMSTRFSGNGQLPIARPWTRTQTLSWNH